MHKYPANGDTRSMREDLHHRRGSPDRRASPASYGRGPPQPMSPRSRPPPPQSPTARSHMSGHRRSNSSDARRERERDEYERRMVNQQKMPAPYEQPTRRPADETYRPSDAAHHPVPPMQMPGPPPPSMHQMQGPSQHPQGPPQQELRGLPRPPSSGPQSHYHPPMVNHSPGPREQQGPPTPTGQIQQVPVHQHQQQGPPPPPPRTSSIPPPPLQQQPPPSERKDVEMKMEDNVSAVHSNNTAAAHSSPGRQNSRPASVLGQRRNGPAQEERYEAPARKMEIDDDYDNDDGNGNGSGSGSTSAGKISPKSGVPPAQLPVAVNGGGGEEGGN